MKNFNKMYEEVEKTIIEKIDNKTFSCGYFLSPAQGVARFSTLNYSNNENCFAASILLGRDGEKKYLQEIIVKIPIKMIDLCNSESDIPDYTNLDYLLEGESLGNISDFIFIGNQFKNKKYCFVDGEIVINKCLFSQANIEFFLECAKKYGQYVKGNGCAGIPQTVTEFYNQYLK